MPLSTVMLMPYPVLTDTPDIPRDIKAVTDRIELLFGSSWTAYTPSWTADNGAPVLGNGTIFGRYQLLGKRCAIEVFLNFGTTTSGGQGLWRFSYPSGVVPLATFEQWGFLHAFVPLAGGNFTGGVHFQTASMAPFVPVSTTDFRPDQARNTDSGGLAGSSRPQVASIFSWANSANLMLAGTFETT